MSGVDTGIVRKLYRDTGTFASPTRVEVDNIRDLTRNAQFATAKSFTRGRRRRRSKTTFLEESFSFTMEVDKAIAAEVANYEAFRSVFYNLSGNQSLILWMLDGADDVEDNQGLHAWFTITQFNESEPAEDVVTIDITVELATDDGGDAAEWHVVPAA